MSTPPDERPPVEDHPDADQSPHGRRNTAPLVWLLLLVALAAGIWYIGSQRDTAEVPVDPVAPVDGLLEEDDEAAVADETPPPPTSASDPARSAPAPFDRAAEPVARVQPAYPVAALRAREEGTVLLRVEVDAQGLPTSVDIERSSRSRELDRAARDAVKQWTFSPAIENGQPVPATVTVPVEFMVEDSPG